MELPKLPLFAMAGGDTLPAVTPSLSPTLGCTRNRAAWLAGLALCVAAVAALAVDLPLVAWFGRVKLPGELNRLVAFSEVFGHGLGVAMILLTVAVLDPLGWRLLPRLAAASLGAGLAANVVKLLLARTRPRHFHAGGPAELPDSIRESFVGWLPGLGASSDFQSFPSGHAATAAGLAVALAWRYPRGRWLFPVLAALACSQRLVSSAHFASDVLAGAALGCLIGAACTTGGADRRHRAANPRALEAPETGKIMSGKLMEDEVGAHATQDGFSIRP